MQHRIAAFLVAPLLVVAAGIPAQCPLRWLPSPVGGILPRLGTTPSGDVLAFGSFTSIEGVPANGIARFDGNGWLAFGSGLAGTVAAAVELPGGDIVAGGVIAPFGGAPTPSLLRWNGTTWQAFAPAPSSGIGIQAMAALPDGSVAVGGDWSTSATTGGTRIERWDGVSWQVIGTASGVSGNQPLPHIIDLAVLPSGELLALGDWIRMLPFGGGVGFYNELVRWDGSVWHHFGERPYPSALHVAPNGDVLFGWGTYALTGGVNRWNGSTWLPTVALSGVIALAGLPNGDYVVGGDSMVLPSTPWTPPPALLRRVDATGGTALLATGVGGVISDLAFHRDGILLVSGQLTDPAVEVTTTPYLVTDCRAVAVAQGASCVGPGGPLVLAATTLPWTGATFQSSATGFASNVVAVAAVGFSSLQIPLSALHPGGLPGCDLLVSTELVLPLLPNGGVAGLALAIPNSAAFAGVMLFHQFVQMEIPPAVLTFSSSNRLALTVGTY